MATMAGCGDEAVVAADAAVDVFTPPTVSCVYNNAFSMRAECREYIDPRWTDALIATGFPYDRRPRIDTLLARLRGVLLNCQGARRGGSAALDLCELAAGRLDAYYEDTLQPWDIAAGIAIVEAAGGVVRGFGAVDPTWKVSANVFGGTVLASNPGLGPKMAALLASAEPAVRSVDL